MKLIDQGTDRDGPSPRGYTWARFEQDGQEVIIRRAGRVTIDRLWNLGLEAFAETNGPKNEQKAPIREQITPDSEPEPHFDTVAPKKPGLFRRLFG